MTAREPHGIVGSKSSAELRKVTVANDSWSSSVVKQSCNPTWSDEDVHDFVVTRIRWTWNMLARDILELGIVGVIFFFLRYVEIDQIFGESRSLLHSEAKRNQPFFWHKVSG